MASLFPLSGKDVLMWAELCCLFVAYTSTGPGTSLVEKGYERRLHEKEAEARFHR